MTTRSDRSKADLFAPGDVVDITGTSKERALLELSRGTTSAEGPCLTVLYHRRTGSLGATDPARVFKGRKMPGRMGGDTVTISGLEIVRVTQNAISSWSRSCPWSRGGHG